MEQKRFHPQRLIQPCNTTFYTAQAQRLKALEKENTRLQRLLAVAELDKAILKEAASGNF